MKAYRRVLALGAHTDDIELGCGGLMSRLSRGGCELLAAAFSRAEQSLPDSMAADTLEREFRAAMRHLDLAGDSVWMGRVPVRRFPEFRQDVLEDLVQIKRDFDPDLILTMNSKDTHQDHEVVHEESVRAFRGRTVLGYETPWNQQQSVVNLLAELTEDDLSTKTDMLTEYRSQARLNRSYIDPEYVRSAARFRGVQAGAGLAEAYEVITMNWSAS